MELSVELIADLVINIVSIIVLFFVVRKLAYKPIKKFMDERTSRIMKEKEEAKALAEASESKRVEYETLLAKCESIETDAIRKGEEAARVEARNIIDNANKKAEEIVSKAQQKADERLSRAIEDSRDEIINATMDISSKLLGREITDADNRKIIDSFLAGLGDENA